MIVLKYRWGCLWTAKRALLFKKPYCGEQVRCDNAGQALCPLCQKPDSGTHAMGGCTATPALHALYTKRHDEAVKRIQQTICMSRLGQCAMLMDAGRCEDLPEGVGKGRDLQAWLRLAPAAPSQSSYRVLQSQTWSCRDRHWLT